MINTISALERKKARAPHNLFMLNLALIHLLMTPAIIALDIGLVAILLPLSLSLIIIGVSHMISRHYEDQPYIYKHWLLAHRHYKFLIISYLITAALLALGSLIALSSPDPHMQSILQTVFIRIAIMPVVLGVMLCFFLESSALTQTTKDQNE